MNHDYCCFDCAMNAMSASLVTTDNRSNMPSIPKLVNGHCPVCGSSESLDLSEPARQTVSMAQ